LDNDESIASFVAPDVKADTILVFQLTVTDDDGASHTSAISVTILFNNTNQPPTAIVASDYSITELLQASLDGSASNDVDGNIVSYTWSQVTNIPNVNLENSHTSITSFITPDVSSATILIFKLVVTDNGGLTNSANIEVTVMPTTGGGSILSFYFSDCGINADPDCVSGSDSNDGLTPDTAMRTYDRAQDLWSQLDSNSSILFARGGSFEVTGSVIWSNYSSDVDNPVTVSDYQPLWGTGNEARPIIIQNNNTHVFELNNGGDARHQSGFTFENLDIRCTAANPKGWGFFLFNDIDDVTIDNVHINGCEIGIHAAGANACDVNDTHCNGLNERLTLKNSSIINNTGQGFLGAGDGYIFENNLFSGNGTGATFTHNFYLSGTSNNVRISGNTIRYAALNASGICSATSFVVHGIHSNLLIENNVVLEEIEKVSLGCWGLIISPATGQHEAFVNVTIRGNKIINVGNTGIGVASCENCIIENNLIVQNQSMEFTAISTPVNNRAANDLTMNSVTIRNNSIYFGASTRGTAIKLGTEGTGHLVVNNAIHYDGNVSFNCLNLDLPLSSYTAINHNICSYESTSAGQWELGSGNLVSWQATGAGTNSLNLLPGFTSTTGPS